MSFSPEERAALLKVKGVGPTVVGRLEQLGITSLSQLASADALEIVTQASPTAHREAETAKAHRG